MIRSNLKYIELTQKVVEIYIEKIIGRIKEKKGFLIQKNIFSLIYFLYWMKLLYIYNNLIFWVFNIL